MKLTGPGEYLIQFFKWFKAQMSQLLKQSGIGEKKFGKKKLTLDLKIGVYQDKDIGDALYQLPMMKTMI